MAIGLLLAGRPFADVAREVGIDATTLYSWRQEPAFALELHSQFALMREATLYGLFSLAADSIAALRTALKSPAEMARVAAAQTVLDRLGIRDRPQ
jgi:transposase-like protein